MSSREAVKAADPSAAPGIDPARLLAWYDRHRRTLPWRASSGERPDAYRVWLSEIMLQQTTVTAVGPYYERFLARFPTVESLAAATLDEVLSLWAGLGYYSRARNLHACARALIAQHGGRFPRSAAQLALLPGIGPYTAAAIAAIAFDEAVVPVDGNVERLVTRLWRIADELPRAKPAIRALAQRLTPARRHGDFAQALMDLGATICTVRRPACSSCPWQKPCAARLHADQETYPRRGAKRQGELRRGVVLVIGRADGAILVRTRPSKGLLGGMTEVPGSEWSVDFDEDLAVQSAWDRLRPFAATWRRLPGHVAHAFTHFPLELAVCHAQARADAAAPRGHRWLPLAAIGEAAFPTLMQKVLAHAGVEPRAGRDFLRRPRPVPV
jgi:A/G-specific adenine glycosylase